MHAIVMIDRQRSHRLPATGAPTRGHITEWQRHRADEQDRSKIYDNELHNAESNQQLTVSTSSHSRHRVRSDIYNILDKRRAGSGTAFAHIRLNVSSTDAGPATDASLLGIRTVAREEARMSNVDQAANGVANSQETDETAREADDGGDDTCDAVLGRDIVVACRAHCKHCVNSNLT